MTATTTEFEDYLELEDESLHQEDFLEFDIRPLASTGPRLVALESKATKRPLAERLGRALAPLGLAPDRPVTRRVRAPDEVATAVANTKSATARPTAPRARLGSPDEGRISRAARDLERVAARVAEVRPALRAVRPAWWGWESD